MTTTIKHPGINQYNQVKGLEAEKTKPQASIEKSHEPFSSYLNDVINSSKTADSTALKAIDGKASSLEVMRATTDAEKKTAEFMQIWTRIMQVAQDLERKNV